MRTPSRLVLRKLYAKLEKTRKQGDIDELEVIISILIDVIELRNQMDLIMEKIDKLQ